MKAWETQRAIYSRLTGFAALTSLVSTRIYDHAPPTATFPYVVIGEATSIPFDTHSTVGAERTETIHTWSRHDGVGETKQIQEAIYDALHQHALAVSGATTVNCAVEYEESFIDPDGLTRHGVQRVRLILDGV